VTPSPDAIARIRQRLDGAPLPLAEARARGGPMIAPDGRELSESEYAGYRMVQADSQLEMLEEFLREPRALVEIPDLRPIPVWAWALALSAAVVLLMGQAFLGLLLMILWIKF
jgi:hypothetical protein